MSNKQDLRDEANFMAGMLTWDEVVSIARNDGYKGPANKPGEVVRYLAWRKFQANHRPVGILGKKSGGDRQGVNARSNVDTRKRV